MVEFGILAIMLLPQLWLARCRFNTAAHLTVLLASLICVTVYFALAPGKSAPPDAADAINLVYTGFTAIGLAGLVPLFWALQQMFPTYNFAIATTLAQTLSLVLTAALVTAGSGSTDPTVIEWVALGLVAGLYGAGLHVVHYGKMK
jgi:hypothetical protein